jgi:hypothetical protein
LRDESDFARHLGCTHVNPVKHGYAAQPQDWLYAWFRRWVRLGAYPANRAGGRNLGGCPRDRRKVMGFAPFNPYVDIG